MQTRQLRGFLGRREDGTNIGLCNCISFQVERTVLLFSVAPLGSVNPSPFGDWDAMVWVWQGCEARQS